MVTKAVSLGYVFDIDKAYHSSGLNSSSQATVASSSSTEKAKLGTWTSAKKEGQDQSKMICCNFKGKVYLSSGCPLPATTETLAKRASAHAHKKRKGMHSCDFCDECVHLANTAAVSSSYVNPMIISTTIVTSSSHSILLINFLFDTGARLCFGSRFIGNWLIGTGTIPYNFQPWIYLFNSFLTRVFSLRSNERLENPIWFQFQFTLIFNFDSFLRRVLSLI